MTIRPGEPWGREVARPQQLVVAADDAAAVELLERDGDISVVLAGGDLHHSLGSPGERDPMMRLAIDAIRVELECGSQHTAIAHVVVRRSWWRGEVIGVMNVEQLGSWKVAPRAHPNDGTLDVVEVAPSMSVRDRWTARSRLPTGTHVPHPDIRVTRAKERSWRFGDVRHVWVDGIRVGSASAIAVSVEPDAFTIFV